MASKSKQLFLCSFSSIVWVYSIIIFLIMNITISAQSDYQVEFYKSKGVLTRTDLYKKDFGRYKGFEIPANKGEGGSFVIYSAKFRPSLILIDEKGNVIKETPGRDEHTAILSVQFPSSGNFILYLLADSSALGEYQFQYGFASEKSLSIKSDADFKNGMNYLLEHCKAFFLFFDNQIDGLNSFYKLEGSIDVRIESDGSYTSIFYKGSDLNAARDVFNSFSSKLQKFFDISWKKESADAKQNKNITEKFISFKEKNDDEPRTVKLSLFDFSKAKDIYKYDYGVTLTISKEHN